MLRRPTVTPGIIAQSEAMETSSESVSLPRRAVSALLIDVQMQEQCQVCCCGRCSVPNQIQCNSVEISWLDAQLEESLGFSVDKAVRSQTLCLTSRLICQQLRGDPRRCSFSSGKTPQQLVLRGQHYLAGYLPEIP